MYITAHGRAKALKTHASSSFSGKLIVLFILYILTLSAALLVVYNKFEHRKFFAKQQDKLRNYEELLMQRSQLMLEYNTLSSYTHLEKLAKNRFLLERDKFKGIILLDETKSN